MAATQIEVKLNFVGGVLSSLELAVDKSFSAQFAFVPQSLLSLLSKFTDAPQSVTADHDDLLKNHNTVPVVEEKKRSVEVWNKDHEKLFEELISKISANHAPELCEEGVNGTYFLKNENAEPVAVFKPQDEEMSKSEDEKVIPLLDGESAHREVAAYLLDHEEFFGVPKTTLAHVQFPDGNKKFGSLQEFVNNDGASWDMGPSKFPVHEVHKIGILDLYMLNVDRHGGNILVKELDDGSCSLIPIDNGFSLPDTLAVPSLWFEWMNWAQAKQPFTKEELEFIERLDVNHDIEMLRSELGIREECLSIMKLTGTMLKKGAAAGLTLFQLGQLICPPATGGPSILQSFYESSTKNEDSFNVDEIVMKVINSAAQGCLSA